MPELIYYSDARIVALPASEGTPASEDTTPLRLAVLCAGTTDIPVAEEAAVTGELFGLSVDRLYDVGVAGLHRLLQRLPVVRQADVVICVAGMDGALPSVVGGLVRPPAQFTSSPHLSMSVSCFQAAWLHQWGGARCCRGGITICLTLRVCLEWRADMLPMVRM